MVITGFFASLLGLLLVVLSIIVIKARNQYKIVLGDDNNYQMQRHIRGHANFIEYTPVFLILLGLLEYMQFSDFCAYLLGTIFLIARISHAYGIMFAEKITPEGKPVNIHYRIIGMMGTFGCITTASVCLLVLSLFKLM
jgi:uncharacterized membrane protein YecN with MAPEG domain